MKKTYLIKDRGKGLVENLTPDKLFDIASGNSDGVDNSNDYSIDEIQVGKFIYRNAGGDKVSKLKYKILILKTDSLPSDIDEKIQDFETDNYRFLEYTKTSDTETIIELAP